MFRFLFGNNLTYFAPFQKYCVLSNELKMSTARQTVMLANAVHKPFDTRIFHKEALALIQAGWNVTIIVPHTSDEQVQGVQVIAVPLPQKGWEQLLKCPWNIFRKALSQPRQAIVHIHDSELLVIGLMLRLTGRTVIYDAHEDTPLQIMYQHWIPRWAKLPYKWFYYALEKICGWFFNAVIVAEPVIARHYPKRKTFLVRNFPKAETFQRDVIQPYHARENTLIYVGLLSRVRGLAEMLEGYRLAKAKVNLVFKLGGKFAPITLKEELFDRYDATYLGWVNYRELIDLLYQSKIGIIIPHPVERYKTNYPVKLFEYMATGIPVIASKFGESATFVTEAACGMVVDPLNPEEVAAAMVWLLEHPDQAMEMGARGRAKIFSEYNWEQESEVLLSVYDRLQQ
ncbi:MAG: glycosyltransferase family 4 protein [Cyclobacteriaceae bacterium]|nr:glycosyltransferase family 4 protein [Cyclobacteriaceae bacterium]